MESKNELLIRPGFCPVHADSARSIMNGLMRPERQEVGVGRAEDVGTTGCAAGGRTTVTVETTELVRVEKADLPGRDLMDNGPVVPHGPPQTDEDGSFTVRFEKATHLIPELVKRRVG